jgi:hypothetical protein
MLANVYYKVSFHKRSVCRRDCSRLVPRDWEGHKGVINPCDANIKKKQMRETDSFPNRRMRCDRADCPITSEYVGGRNAPSSYLSKVGGGV